ncbi:hypothetical protein [Bradyrhizobium sp. USDA 4474]
MLLESGAVVALNFLPDDARGPQAIAELREVGKVIAAPGDVRRSGIRRTDGLERFDCAREDRFAR